MFLSYRRGLAVCCALLLPLWGTGCNADKTFSISLAGDSSSQAVTYLSVPKDLEATSDVGRIGLQWSEVEDADGYCIYRKGPTDAGYVLAEEVRSAAILFTDLKAGETYAFFVTAYAGEGDARVVSEGCKPIQATVGRDTPNAPTGILGTAGPGCAQMSWGAVEGADGYEVFCRAAGKADYVSMLDTKETTARVSGLPGKTECTLYVQSYILENGVRVYSEPSQTVTVTPDDAVLSAPTGLTGAVGSGEVQLSWESVANASGYEVYMLTPDNRTYAVATTVTKPEALIRELTNGKAYSFYVQAYLQTGDTRSFGTPCDPITVTPEVSGLLPPAKLTAEAGNGKIVLSWSAVPGAEYYQIFQAGSNPTFRNIRTVKHATTTTLTGLQNGQSYGYAVRACASVNGATRFSELSALASAVPTAPTTAAPPQTTAKPQTQKPTTTTVTPPPTNASYAAEVLRLVNDIRAQNGLSLLTSTTALQNAAQARTAEIATSFSHTRPNGKSCFTILGEHGVSYRAAGENIAMGQKTPAAVVDAWMNSEGHRANILNASFTQLGVGYDASRSGWVQLFIG